MARAEVDPTSIARDVGSFCITGVDALDVPPHSDPLCKLGRLAPQPPRLTVAKTMTHSLAVFMRIVPPNLHPMAQSALYVNGRGEFPTSRRGAGTSRNYSKREHRERNSRLRPVIREE